MCFGVRFTFSSPISHTCQSVSENFDPSLGHIRASNMATAAKALEVYTKGTEAWFPDETEGWLMGKLTTKTIDGDKVKLVFHIDSLRKVRCGDFAEPFLE